MKLKTKVRKSKIYFIGLVLSVLTVIFFSCQTVSGSREVQKEKVLQMEIKIELDDPETSTILGGGYSILLGINHPDYPEYITIDDDAEPVMNVEYSKDRAVTGEIFYISTWYAGSGADYRADFTNAVLKIFRQYTSELPPDIIEDPNFEIPQEELLFELNFPGYEKAEVVSVSFP